MPGRTNGGKEKKKEVCVCLCVCGGGGWCVQASYLTKLQILDLTNLWIPGWHKISEFRISPLHKLDTVFFFLGGGGWVWTCLIM